MPKRLYQAIIRIQADEDLDFHYACLVAARLVDPRRKEYRNAVQREVENLGKSRFMKQINKARTTIKDNAMKRGASYVRNHEDNFRVPCKLCGKYMYFSSKDQNWDKIKEYLYQAFRTWSHTSCKQ